jgi:delta-aminolevulinic acid dehydratase/porphobilinogen synthase
VFVAPGRSPPSLDRVTRHRRNEWTRRTVRENVLTTGGLIWPLFIVDGEKKRIPVGAMPGSNGYQSTRRCAKPSASSLVLGSTLNAR